MYFSARRYWKARSSRVLYNQYQKHVTCNYGHKIVCADINCSKSFNSYLGENVVCHFNYSMIEESKYCCEVLKKLFNKKLVITKEYGEDCENSTKC